MCSPWDPRCKSMESHLFFAFLPTGDYSTFMNVNEALEWLEVNNAGVGIIHKLQTEIIYLLKQKPDNIN